jgi:hypothetical protein
VLGMAERETPGDHFTSHAVFCHKVLGESWGEAMRIARAFREHALTREECEKLAADWERCDDCGTTVPGGTPLCGACTSPMTTAA